MVKKKSNKINPFIFALICAVLLFVAYNSLATLALGLWGQTAMGTVDSYDSRLDDSNAGQNRSRTISKGYSFSVGGKEYRGYVMYHSDEAWPRLKAGETRSERISYFSFFPYINKPSMLTNFDQMGEAALLYHLFAPIGSVLLFLLVTGKLIKKKKAVKKVAAVPEIKHNNGGVLMDNTRYASLSEAVIVASTRCDKWRFAMSDESYYRSGLRVMAQTHDEENPADEDSFYIVSPAGAIGFSEDGETIEWLFLPLNHPEDLPLKINPETQMNFCSNCGGRIISGARFCGACGMSLY